MARNSSLLGEYRIFRPLLERNIPGQASNGRNFLAETSYL
jgi:hypothetical protein